MLRMAKEQETSAKTEEETKQNLLLVDHLPEAALESFPEVLNGEETTVTDVDSTEHQDQSLHNGNGERSIEATDKEVDPLESSYYMIDKLLTKLINIGIERNECQIRRVEVVKELEKAKKLHDYVASLSLHNGTTIQRQEGAYILQSNSLKHQSFKYILQNITPWNIKLLGSYIPPMFLFRGVYFPHAKNSNLK